MKMPSDYAFNLLSITGAAVAGFGLGALLHSFVGGAAVITALIGLLAHGIGMWGRTMVGHQTTSTWQPLLYWLCWIVSLAVSAYLLISWQV
jgi:hypothetical protein